MGKTILGNFLRNAADMCDNGQCGNIEELEQILAMKEEENRELKRLLGYLDMKIEKLDKEALKKPTKRAYELKPVNKIDRK